jgi:hypothetical protein
MPASSELSYIGQIASSLCHVCAAAQVNQSRTTPVQGALRNYARWVDQADGIEVWLPENQLGNSC